MPSEVQAEMALGNVSFGLFITEFLAQPIEHFQIGQQSLENWKFIQIYPLADRVKFPGITQRYASTIAWDKVAVVIYVDVPIADQFLSARFSEEMRGWIFLVKVSQFVGDPARRNQFGVGKTIACSLQVLFDSQSARKPKHFELIVEEPLVDHHVAAKDLFTNSRGSFDTLKRNLLDQERIDADEDAVQTVLLQPQQPFPSRFIVPAPKAVRFDKGRGNSKPLGDFYDLEKERKVQEWFSASEMNPIVDADPSFLRMTFPAGIRIPSAKQSRELRQNPLCILHRDPITLPPGRTRIHAVLAAAVALVGEKDSTRKWFWDEQLVHG
jgi:hypothetical protein